MNTRVYRVFCEGSEIGRLFVTDDNPAFPNHTLATLWIIIKTGQWELGTLELNASRSFTNIFPIGRFTDDEIAQEMLRLAGKNCATVRITRNN